MEALLFIVPEAYGLFWNTWSFHYFKRKLRKNKKSIRLLFVLLFAGVLASPFFAALLTFWGGFLMPLNGRNFFSRELHALFDPFIIVGLHTIFTLIRMTVHSAKHKACDRGKI